MKPETLKIIETVIKLDLTLSPLEQKKLIEKLKAPLDAQNTMEQIILAPDQNRVLKRKASAFLLGVDVKTLDRLARENGINRVCYPFRKKSAGYLLGDILRLQNNFKKAV